MAALRFVQQPASAEALVPARPVRIELVDADGEVTPVSGVPIEVQVAPSPSGTRVVGDSSAHLSTDGRVVLDATTYDLPGHDLRLVARGGPLSATSEPFDVSFTRPVVAFGELPGEVSSCASIPYTVTQAQGHPVDLLVEVDPDGPAGPAPFARARQAASEPGEAGVQGAPTRAIGRTQTFAWNSSFDLPGQDADVTLRLTPRVGGASGAPVTSALVHVANGTRFRASEEAVPALSLLRITDVDRDGWPDSLRVIGTTLTVSYGGPDEASAEVSLSSAARDVTVGDLDADGLQDLAVATDGGIALVAQTRSPRRQLRIAGSVDGAASVRQVAAADLDHDGLVDLVGVHGDGEVVAFRQTGSQTEPLASLGTVWSGSATGRIAVVDRPLQGALDVVIGQSSGPAAVVTWEAGRFAPPHFESFVTGGEVAAADLDHDGEQDLISLSPEGLRIQLGGAPGRQLGPFADINGTHVLVGDLDGDARPDLVVTTATSSVIYRLHLEAGGGEPERVAELEAAGAVPVAVVDVDRDGRLDVIAANLASGQVTTFAAVTPRRCGARFGGPQATGVMVRPGGDEAIADVDADGKLDLVTFDEGLELASGRGDGTFAPARRIAESSAQVLDFATADLDEDGAVDVVYLDAEASTVKLLYQDAGGDVSFTPQLLATADCPQAVAVADLDADGQLDVAVLGPADVEVFYSTSRRDHVFAAPRRLPGVGPVFGCHSLPTHLVAVDIDGDGRLELVATGYSHQVVFPADPGDPRGFRDAVISEHPASPLIAVADVVGDARPELVLKGSRNGHDELRAFTFAPDFTTPMAPTWFAIYPGVATPSDFFKGTAIDLDGDGDFEVATAVGPEGSSGTAVVTPRRFASGGRISDESILPVNGQPQFADVDADGILDLVTGAFVAAGLAPRGRFDVGTWLGPLGKQMTTTPLASVHVVAPDESSLAAAWFDGGSLQVGRCARPAGPCQLGAALPAVEPALLADLDLDGYSDVVATGPSDEVAFLADAAGDAFSAVCPVTIHIEPRAVADLDGEGQPDLLVTSGVAVGWIKSPASTCSPPELLFTVPPPITGSPLRVDAADLNADGLIDIVVVGDEVHVAVQSASTPMTFPTLQHYGPYTEPYDLDIADLDRDGLPDLIVNNPNGPLLYRSDPTLPGRLSSGSTLGIDAAQANHDLVLADIDADGWLDLFDTFDGSVLLQDPASPGHFHRACGISPSVPGARVGTGPWALLDFDGDGRLDQLVWRAESGLFLERGR